MNKFLHGKLQTGECSLVNVRAAERRGKVFSRAQCALEGSGLGSGTTLTPVAVFEVRNSFLRATIHAKVIVKSISVHVLLYML